MKFLFSLLPVVLPACELEDGPIVCTGEEVPSVMVTVEDAFGEAIDDAVASYSVDGGPDMDCGGNSPFICGTEIEGTFLITATAEGYDEETASVEVTGDECHVTTEEVTIELAATE